MRAHAHGGCNCAGSKFSQLREDGLLCAEEALCAVEDSTFSDFVGAAESGLDDAAIYIISNASVLATNCEFVNNKADFTISPVERDTTSQLFTDTPAAQLKKAPFSSKDPQPVSAVPESLDFPAATDSGFTSLRRVRT